MTRLAHAPPPHPYLDAYVFTVKRYRWDEVQAFFVFRDSNLV